MVLKHLVDIGFKVNNFEANFKIEKTCNIDSVIYVTYKHPISDGTPFKDEYEAVYPEGFMLETLGEEAMVKFPLVLEDVDEVLGLIKILEKDI